MRSGGNEAEQGIHLPLILLKGGWRTFKRPPLLGAQAVPAYHNRRAGEFVTHGRAASFPPPTNGKQPRLTPANRSRPRQKGAINDNQALKADRNLLGRGYPRKYVQEENNASDQNPKAEGEPGQLDTPSSRKLIPNLRSTSHPVMEQKKARYLNQWGFSRITQGSASTSSSGAGCGTARGTPAPPPLLLPAAAG